MSFSMMTIQPSVSQDVKDNEEWERKKKKQTSEMALANARANPTGSVDRNSSFLGVNGIGSANQQPMAKKTQYPTPADLPKYDSIGAAQAGQQQAMRNMLSTGFGQGYSAKANPKPSTPNAIPNMQGGGVSSPTAAITAKQADQAASPVMSDDAGPISANQGGKSYGLSITPSANRVSPTEAFAAQLAAGANGNGAAGNPVVAPRRSQAEEAERAAVMKQASTVQAGANGITAAQLGVQRSLTEGNDSLNNDVYKAQLGAQNSIEQAQIREQGANGRAVLGELSAEQRQSQQLGFDAEKFQQSVGLDTRRLDMQQANDDIKNRPQKDLNALYDNLKAAETDEDRSMVTAQINALKGIDPKDREDWGVAKGPQVMDANGMAMDGPPILYNKRNGETRPIDASGGAGALDMNNPKVAAIVNNGKWSDEVKAQKLKEAGFEV